MDNPLLFQGGLDLLSPDKPLSADLDPIFSALHNQLLSLTHHVPDPLKKDCFATLQLVEKLRKLAALAEPILDPPSKIHPRNFIETVITKVKAHHPQHQTDFAYIIQRNVPAKIHSIYDDLVLLFITQIESLLEKNTPDQLVISLHLNFSSSQTPATLSCYIGPKQLQLVGKYQHVHDNAPSPHGMLNRIIGNTILKRLCQTLSLSDEKAYIHMPSPFAVQFDIPYLPVY